ncbi:3966_t:CDS:2, partial [Dentiscutata erythropus]
SFIVFQTFASIFGIQSQTIQPMYSQKPRTYVTKACTNCQRCTRNALERLPALSTTQNDTLLTYRTPFQNSHTAFDYLTPEAYFFPQEHGNSNYDDMTNCQNINSINSTPLLFHDYNVATSLSLIDYVSNSSFRVPPTLLSNQLLLSFAPFNLSG